MLLYLMNIFSGSMNHFEAEARLDDLMPSWSFVPVTDYILNCHWSLTEQYTGRSCRCILMLGHGYEPVVDFVLLILKYSNFPIPLTSLYSTLMSLNFVIKNIFLTPLDFTLLSRNVFKLKFLVPLHPFQPYWNSHLN